MGAPGGCCVTLLLVQMTIMLLVALVCGWMARKLGQSRVIGEIIGGVLILIGVEDHGKEAQDLSVIEAA